MLKVLCGLMVGILLGYLANISGAADKPKRYECPTALWIPYFEVHPGENRPSFHAEWGLCPDGVLL
jgi:hypothetical protein